MGGGSHIGLQESSHHLIKVIVAVLQELTKRLLRGGCSVSTLMEGTGHLGVFTHVRDQIGQFVKFCLGHFEDLGSLQTRPNDYEWRPQTR